MATITTDTYLDEGGARTAGEAWTMNGAVLTIRTDTRWHANSPASMVGSIAATTISATLGGGVLIDATAVREVQFDSGSGNVPAIGTVITQGGASGYLLGVWADLNSAPTVVGNLMPITGFIKFREVTGSFSAGVLTGIGASALGVDTVSWIEVVQRQVVANTVPRLGFWRTRGNWYTLPQTTNGVAGQIIQIPTNGGGVGTHVPAIWIETGVGTNEYEAFPAILGTWFIPTNLGTDARAKFVETMGSGQVRIGNNGTGDVGFLPPAGCRIRIPNILGRQSTSAGGDANNQTPHATLASRPDWTTTAAGDIDFEYFMDDWYHLFSAPYRVKHVNCATFDIHSTVNEAAPTNLNNYVTGSYNGTSISLTLSTNPLGGTIQNCKFIRAGAGSNSHAVSLNLCTDYVFTNCHVGVITFARSTGRSIAVAQSLNIVFNDIYQYNSYMQFTTSFSITVNDLDHCDRFVGNTDTASGMYCVAVLTSSDDIKVDGLTFGLKGTLPGYHNPYLAPFYTINSSNITFRNAGTRTVPLLVNPAAQSIYAAHDAGANTNVRFQRIYLDNTRTSVYLTVNTSKNITFESVHGTTGAVQTLALNVLSKGIRATTNSVTAGASVYGSHYFDMFVSDIQGIVWFAMNEPTVFSEDYVTLTLVGATGGFTSGGQVSLPNVGDQLVIEMPYFAIGHTGFDSLISPIVTGVNPENFSYEYDIDTGNDFSGSYKNLMKTKVRAAGGSSGTNTITLTAKDSPMPEVGDFILSPAGTQYSPGTTVTDVTGNVVTVSNNFLVNLTGTVYFIKDITNEVIDESVGLKLRLRITTTDALNTNALTYVSVRTLSTLNAQIDNLYPLDYSTITISGFVANSRVRIYDSTNNIELFNEIVSGTSMSYSAPYAGDYTANVRVMYQSPTIAYLLEEFDDIVTVNGLNRSVVQVLDTVYNTNAVDGETVTGITVDYSIDRIFLEDSTTWANIYARKTFRLYQENGISEKDTDSFLFAVDTANYKLSNLKLLNVSDPSVPIGITGGWAVDFTTNKSVDTVDNTGGTIFSMPDHVIPYETSGGSGSGASAADIWSYGTRALSSSGVNAIQSGLATESNVNLVKAITDRLNGLIEDVSGDRFTAKALEEASGGTGTAPTEAEMYNYFTDGVRPNAFKADVSGLAPAGEYDLELAAIQADLDNPDQYKANVSGLSTFNSTTDSVTVGNPNDCKANVSGLATSLEIAALNDLSAAEVNTEVDAALAGYDSPTKAELDLAQSAIESSITSLNDISVVDVWSHNNKALTDKAGFSISGTKQTLDALNDLSESQVNAQVDSSLSDYDPPTRAELTTDINSVISEVNANETKIDAIQADLDNPDQYKANISTLATSIALSATQSAIQADISNLNDLSEAQINSQVDLALSDYDSPTKAELDAAQAAIQLDLDTIPTSLDIADKVWDENLTQHTTANSAGDILLNIDPDTLAANILDGIVEGTYTLKQMVRLMASVLAGKTSGGDTNILRFRDLSDTKNRVVATVDSNSNRTNVVLDGD